MGLYENIKDVANVLQKADNIELYSRLIDLSSQALDMQDELSKLRTENRDLKEKKRLEDKIVRHPELFITLKDEQQNIVYCTHCWDAVKKLIQGHCDSIGQMYCPECKERFIIDRNKYNSRSRKAISIPIIGY